jgi:TP901-1 family phage major tail protein
MTAQKGDSVILKVGNGATPTEVFTAVGGFRSNSFKLDNKIIEANNLSSGRWQKLIAAGINKVSVKGRGYFTDSAAEEILRAYAFAGSLNNYEFYFGNGDKISGAFIIAEYERSGDFGEQEDFTATLESAGAVSFVAG